MALPQATQCPIRGGFLTVTSTGRVCGLTGLSALGSGLAAGGEQPRQGRAARQRSGDAAPWASVHSWSASIRSWRKSWKMSQATGRNWWTQ